MARPDCEDGWIKKSAELEAALAYGDFSKYAQVVLRCTFAQVFGRGDRPRHAILSCSEIAAAAGCPKQLVFRGRQELLDAGALVPVAGITNGFAFQKDYEVWAETRRSNGTHWCPNRRLSVAEIADCKAAPGYARSFVPGHQPSRKVIHRDDHESSIGMTAELKPVIHRDDAGHPSGLPKVIHRDDETASPPAPPLLGTELQNIQREEEGGFRLELGSEIAPTPTPRKSSSTPRPNRLPLTPQPPAPAGADPFADAVRALILDATRSKPRPSGNADLADRVVHLASGWRSLNYSEAAIRHALDRALAKGLVHQFDRMKRYAEGVLRRWVEENRPGLAPVASASVAEAPKHRINPNHPLLRQRAAADNHDTPSRS